MQNVEMKIENVIGKHLLKLLKELMKEVEKLGTLGNLISINGNKVILKDVA